MFTFTLRNAKDTAWLALILSILTYFTYPTVFMTDAWYMYMCV